MYLTAYLSEVPRPLFWKEKLSKYGHDILFRYYSGEERQPEQVPYPDYQGYYIQLADRISSTPLKIDTLCSCFCQVMNYCDRRNVLGLNGGGHIKIFGF
ncbi:hypothetical protein [Sphingobacterium sp. BIGb0116]|uniref:hypothetical protein n=1 Tax=Sphingobacterium sp. BIGb0116 TaxID=2940619 RepID=UPI000F9E8A5B|nr:hypothetical protein [Sphingobacterium sp. BIGb0116]MCS4162995.1 hypothetical protein [Sphingobacterium sp. BIGb0116]